MQHITTPSRQTTESKAAIQPSTWKVMMRDVLERIVRVPHVHARWLNTLSLLEHMGSRKIIKALDSNQLDETILRHIAEEARHAHIFKRLSLRVLEGVCATYQPEYLFCGDAAKVYFQSLDRLVADYLDRTLGEHNVELNYLCVTTLVELRAIDLYEIYEDVLKRHSSALSLRAVLAEEDRHLEDMRVAFGQRGLDWSAHQEALLPIEHALFVDLLETLNTTLQAA